MSGNESWNDIFNWNLMSSLGKLILWKMLPGFFWKLILGIGLYSVILNIFRQVLPGQICPRYIHECMYNFICIPLPIYRSKYLFKDIHWCNVMTVRAFFIRFWIPINQNWQKGSSIWKKEIQIIVIKCIIDIHWEANASFILFKNWPIIGDFPFVKSGKKCGKIAIS